MIRWGKSRRRWNARRSGGITDPSAGYALYLPFSAASPTYRSGSTTGALSTMPGYAYTRSGAKQELLASAAGVSSVFAANVPGIVSGVGYYSRAATTNLLLQSQVLDNAAWIKTNCTVTADTSVAPDGTTTVDRIDFTGTGLKGYISQAITPATTQPRTASVFVPKSGGSYPYAWVEISDNSANSGFISLNLSTGAVSAQQILVGAGLTMVGYAKDCGSFWRFVVTWTTSTVAAGACRVGGADTSSSQTQTASGSLSAWQFQDVAGNFPDGGPIIATTGAAASTGADVLSETQTKPTGAFVIYGKASLTATKAATSTLFNWSDGTASNVVSAQLSASNLVTFTVTNATVNTPVTGEGGTPTGVRNVTFALRFNGSTWRGFINGVVMGAESAAAAIPAGTQFNEGHALGASQLNDAMAGIYVIEAAKTDAEVIALMNAL